MDETLVSFGGEIKSVEETGTGWKFGGWLVCFDSHDVSHLRDRFTKSTDFDIQDGDRRSLYYNHGLDGTIKRTRLGDCHVSVKDAGVWIEGEIKKRDDYLQKHAASIAANIKKFGLSSGAPAHLVEREKVAGGHEVKMWPIAEASITPTPAEPMTGCFSLKSLMEAEQAENEIKATFNDVAAANSEALNAMRGRANFSPVPLPETPQRFNVGDEVIFCGTGQKGVVEKATADAYQLKISDKCTYLVSANEVVAPSAKSEIPDDNLPAGKSFADHSTEVLAANEEFIERVEKLIDLRCIKAGRVLSKANYDLLKGYHDSLQSKASAIEALLKEHGPQETPDDGAAAAEAETKSVEQAMMAAYQLTLARINGVPAES